MFEFIIIDPKLSLGWIELVNKSKDFFSELRIYVTVW